MVEQQEEQELPPIPYLLFFPRRGGVELHLPGRREPSWC